MDTLGEGSPIKLISIEQMKFCSVTRISITIWALMFFSLIQRNQLIMQPGLPLVERDESSQCEWESWYKWPEGIPEDWDSLREDGEKLFS